MPTRKTAQKAAGKKSASAKAGEYVHEEIEHVREGKHGARSAKQAIAIGLSKARQTGVKIPPPPGKKGPSTRSKAGHKPNPRRSRAVTSALKKESSSAASHLALSRQARAAAKKRGPAKRKAAAKKAARTRARDRSA